MSITKSADEKSINRSEFIRLTHSTSKSSPTVKRKEFKTAPKFEDNEIVLFCHPYNFYSQKVIYVLSEKHIDFKTYPLDLSNGEQYSEWFLKLNPKADVPVLQDGTLVIPDSRQIINYVENKFRANQLSLQPHDINSYEFERVHYFEEVFTHLPVGALSLGSFLHDDLKLAPKPPFVGPIRKTLLKNNEKVYELLKESLDEADTNKMALLHKLELQDRRRRLVHSRVEYQKVLDAVQNVLVYIENDFKSNPQREWLVGNDLTLADVSFGLLLHRLYQLGFENYYWSYGKLPLVESYFLRFKKRDSYQKVMPNNFDILKDIWQKTPQNYIIGASAGVLGMAMFAAFAHK